MGLLVVCLSLIAVCCGTEAHGTAEVETTLMAVNSSIGQPTSVEANSTGSLVGDLVEASIHHKSVKHGHDLFSKYNPRPKGYDQLGPDLSPTVPSSMGTLPESSGDLFDSYPPALPAEQGPAQDTWD